MPATTELSKTVRELLDAAIASVMTTRTQRRRIARARATSTPGPAAAKPATKRPKLSAAAKKRIAEAQRKRWAEWRAKQKRKAK